MSSLTLTRNHLCFLVFGRIIKSDRWKIGAWSIGVMYGRVTKIFQSRADFTIPSFQLHHFSSRIRAVGQMCADQNVSVWDNMMNLGIKTRFDASLTKHVIFLWPSWGGGNTTLPCPQRLIWVFCLGDRAFSKLACLTSAMLLTSFVYALSEVLRAEWHSGGNTKDKINKKPFLIAELWLKKCDQ